MLSALGAKSIDEVNAINTEIVNVARSFSSIEMANSIFTADKVKTNFFQIAVQYGATVDTLRSLAQVNNWCNVQTHGTIPKILDNLPVNTEMVLLNALHFKGNWQIKFDKEKTYRTTFYNYNDFNKPKKLSEMSITENFNFYYDDEIQMVEMPFLKDSMSAVIILPKKDVKINELVSKLDDNKLHSYLKKMQKKDVQIDLPKFELDFSSSLIESLQAMGMKVPFTYDADFTNMMDKQLKIEVVHQKSYLKIEEEGVIASSGTAVVIVKRGDNPYKMVVDRPFLFMLRNSELPQNYQMVMMAKIEEL